MFCLTLADLIKSCFMCKNVSRQNAVPHIGVLSFAMLMLGYDPKL